MVTLPFCTPCSDHSPFRSLIYFIMIQVTPPPCVKVDLPNNLDATLSVLKRQELVSIYNSNKDARSPRIAMEKD